MTLSGLPRVLAQVEPLARRFTAAGHRIYLVGGVVRDLWLDRDVDGGDIDLTTDARPEATRSIVAPVADQLWTQGERFGTIGCTIAGRSFEITTHRAESYDAASRKPDVIFGDDVTVDLSRRDFTVNAMAWEVPDGTLVDPFGGVADIDAGVLRTPLEPVESFSDDPLRMVRAARFAASLGLRPTPGVLAAMRDLAPRLAIVAVERIREELEDKLLVVPEAAVGLSLLAETGLLAQVIPELAAEEPAARAVRRVEAVPATRLVRLAALLADLDPAALAARLAALRTSNADRRAVSRLVAGARTVSAGPPADAGAIRRLVLDVADPALSGLDEVLALGAALAGDATVAPWRSAHGRLSATEDLTDLTGPLDGVAVAELLGIEPGPIVGEALREQQRIRIADGPLSPDEARRALSGWWKTRAGHTG
ncbi:MAG: CCA tRNA nucleotidyltransferase [Acidimicrobiales bacterium]